MTITKINSRTSTVSDVATVMITSALITSLEEDGDDEDGPGDDDIKILP